MTTTKPLPPISMDDVPMNGFHWRAFACSAGAPYIDGYALGIVGVGLAQMHAYTDVSTFMGALIGMATLAGMFFGSLIGGPITDAIGRRVMFVADFSFILIVCLASFFFTDPTMVFIFRFLLGVGLGADYPIAGPYLSEFVPKKERGSLVGALNALWYVGYASAFVVGYLMLGIGENAWRYMLASPAVVAFIWLILRIVMPESSRWLQSKGRIEEANKVLKRIGPNVILPKGDEAPEQVGKFSDIFKGGYGKWLFFVAAFWSLQVIPVFGIGTYVPTIMETLGFAEGNLQYLGSAVMNVFYLLGLIPIYFLMDKWGRRPTIVYPFLIAGLALIVLGATSGMSMPFWFIMIMFIIYGAFTVAMGAHCWVYPNELFPTHVRGTAMGFVSAVPRIGSAIGTFIFPYILNNWGLAVTLYICGGFFLLGWLLSFIMAPETKGLDLADAAKLGGQESS